MVEDIEKAQAFAKRLKKARMQTGLSQKEFALKADIHYTQYNKYEQGETIPYTESLFKIADTLKVSANYLFDGKEENAIIADIEDKELLDTFKTAEKLPEEDKLVIKRIITALVNNQNIQGMQTL